MKQKANEALDALLRLNSSQLEELIFRLGLPERHLPGEGETFGRRCIAVVRMVIDNDGGPGPILEALERLGWREEAPRSTQWAVEAEAVAIPLRRGDATPAFAPRAVSRTRASPRGPWGRGSFGASGVGP